MLHILLYPESMDSYTIRVFGDPVLKKVAEDVENIDDFDDSNNSLLLDDDNEEKEKGYIK